MLVPAVYRNKVSLRVIVVTVSHVKADAWLFPSLFNEAEVAVTCLFVRRVPCWAFSEKIRELKSRVA